MRKTLGILAIIFISSAWAEAKAQGQVAQANDRSSQILAEIGMVGAAVSAVTAADCLIGLLSDDIDHIKGGIAYAVAAPTTVVGVTLLVRSDSRNHRGIGAMVTAIGLTAVTLGVLNLVLDESKFKLDPKFAIGAKVRF